jgi:hypothetical protein
MEFEIRNVCHSVQVDLIRIHMTLLYSVAYDRMECNIYFVDYVFQKQSWTLLKKCEIYRRLHMRNRKEVIWKMSHFSASCIICNISTPTPYNIHWKVKNFNMSSECGCILCKYVRLEGNFCSIVHEPSFIKENCPQELQYSIDERREASLLHAD